MFRTIRTALAAFAFALALQGAALAQSGCPTIINGAVLTAGQWNACFATKQNVLGFTPLNIAGGVMTGKLTTAAATTLATGFNIAPGVAPTSPNNGDMWTTSGGLFVRINGVTVGPLAPGTSAAFAGTSPITVSFPAGVVTYAFDFTVANTFSAQQTGQGLTGTSPGWYTKITGDANARVLVGLNATDVPSIAFGAGSTVRDTFIERARAAALRFGGPDAAAPVAQTLGVQNVVAGTSNTAGAAFTINGSQGTGTGLGGSLIFQVASAGSTGSAVNALAAALTIDSTKLATFSRSAVFGSPTGGDKGVGTINAAALVYSAGNALATSATSPLVLNATTGVLTCPTCLTGTSGAITANLTTTSGFTAGQFLYSDGSKVQAASFTGTLGNVVLSVSPTITGTATFGIINATNGNFSGNVVAVNTTAVPVGGTQDTGYLFSSTAHFGVIFGSGAPTASMARGSLYLQSDGVPAYNTNGTTGWDTLAGLTATQTLTNKTLTTPTITSPTVTGTMTDPDGGSWSTGGLSLGLSGTRAGALAFANLTSGSVTIAPPAGALGSAVWTLQIATDTFVGRATTDTLTNKTYDTAGTGNVFKINGNGVSAVSGTGSTVCLTVSCALTTPSLGVATATSINGNIFTAGTYTLTGTAGKTLTFQNSLTLAGTDATTMTFPSTSATIARTDAGQTFTGAEVFSNGVNFSSAITYGGVTLSNAVSGTGPMVLGTAPTITGGAHTALTTLGIRDTSAAFDVTLAATSGTALTAGRTLTFNVGNVAHTLALGTTANTITFPNLSSFTVITSGDTGTVTSTILANSISLVTPNINVATGTSLALGGCTISTNALCITGTASISSTLGSGAITVTSAAAGALSVGLAGATNPAFQVDASTALQAAGFKITGAVTGGTVALAAIDSGSNTNITINAKGSGTIGIGNVSTGAVTITPALTGSSTINAVTGFQVNGAATSGNYMRGNGTNFVSSAIQAGDLPLGSASAFGAVKCDNSTITCSAGVITAVGAAASSIAPLTTTVTGGTNLYLLGVTTNGCGSGSPCLAQIQNGQIPATTTNDNASAGNVGEYLSIDNGGGTNGTVTITIATPAVITAAGGHSITVNGTAAACIAIYFTTTGALPTGITASTLYWAHVISSTTLNIATSAANCLAGTYVATSGTQSGVQTFHTNALALTTDTAINLAAIAFPAGDWDMTGGNSFGGGAATTVNYIVSTMGTTSATLNQVVNFYGKLASFGATAPFAASGEFLIYTGNGRASLSGATNYYLVGQMGFNVSTGQINSVGVRARRVR